MLDRLDVLPAVDIQISGDYDETTRYFNANIEIESLRELNGEFKYNVILVEDSIVWAQAGSGGGSDYVHDWTVRDMINGAEGDIIFNGVWDPHQTFSFSISHSISIPPLPAPDIRPEFCRVVVLVYKTGSPLSSHAEIQQAIQVPFVKNNYDVALESQITDVVQSSDIDYLFDILIENTGKSNDEFYLNLEFEGPAAWTCIYTTPNGTYPLGHIDSLHINTGTVQTVQITVNPEMIEGFGIPILHVISKSDPGVKDSIELRFVTSSVENLIIDDDGNEDYENYTEDIFDSLHLDYGILKSSIISINTFSDFDNFKLIIWQTGTTKPGLDLIERNFISHYLEKKSWSMPPIDSTQAL